MLLLLAAALTFTSASAQTALEHKQQSLAKWNIGSAQYSGITALGGNRYALVSDKEPTDGFFVFRIDQSAITGDVTNVYMEGFYGNRSPKVDAMGISTRDCEGIAYVPKTNTVFISGEGDQRILEYDMKGQPTGRELNVPEIFSSKNIVFNYGFEALCYDTLSHTFWTTSESTLPADGPAASPTTPGVQNLLRLQAFNDHLQPTAQYAYRMDIGKKDDFGKTYVLADWNTTVQPFRITFANYEGMCLGRTLPDGRQTLILVNDSQGGYRKGPFHLKDYIKVIVLGN